MSLSNGPEKILAKLDLQNSKSEPIPSSSRNLKALDSLVLPDKSKLGANTLTYFEPPSGGRGHSMDSAVDHATKAAQGLFRIFKDTVDLPDEVTKYGDKLIDISSTLAKLGVNVGDMVWSKSPAQNMENFKTLAGLLLNANSDIVKLDSDIRQFATLNPESLAAVKNVNDALLQMSKIYKELKQDGLDPAILDPKFGKFMDRVDQTAGNFRDFSENYADYVKKAEGLPQIGTVADMVDYGKSIFDLSGKHRMDRIGRNVAANKAIEAWDEFKDNLSKVTGLEDLN